MNLVAANDNQPRRSALPPSLPPRGLCREEAAEFIGVSASTFDLLVKDGTMPMPKKIRSRSVWDRLRLEKAFDALPGDDEANPWDKALAVAS